MDLPTFARRASQSHCYSDSDSDKSSRKRKRFKDEVDGLFGSNIEN